VVDKRGYKKLEVRDFFQVLYLEGDLSDAIDHLKAIQDKYESKYIRLFIEIDYGTEPYDTCYYLHLIGTRLETDKEFEKRIKKDKREKEDDLEKGKQTLKRLKEHVAKLEKELS